MDGIEILKQWLDENNKSLLSLFNKLGFERLLHIKKINNYVVREAFPNNKIPSLEKHYDKLKVLSHGDKIKIDGLEYNCIYNDKRENENSNLILGSGESKYDTFSIGAIGERIIQLETKISILEDSLQLTYHNTDNNNFKEKLQNLSENYVNASVPIVTYSIVHEEIGPSIIASIPETFNIPENIMYVVNIFATIDSEMLRDIGQLFSTYTLSNPEYAESTSIIFTLENPNARGEVEIHAISVVIGRDFVNLSKSQFVNIKSLLFSAAESIRQQHGQNSWNLFNIDIDNIDTNIKLYIDDLLEQLRLQTAGFLAVNISSEDLVNW